jgi:hypothetical protein
MFDSLAKLVEHYQQNPIEETNGNITYLKKSTSLKAPRGFHLPSIPIGSIAPFLRTGPVVQRLPSIQTVPAVPTDPKHYALIEKEDIGAQPPLLPPRHIEATPPMTAHRPGQKEQMVKINT